MKEKEPRPRECFFKNKDCTPDLKLYGFIETPTKPAFDICGFHIQVYKEAFKLIK